MSLSIISAPFNKGQGKTGVEKGPEYLLKHGLQQQLIDLKYQPKLVEPLKSFPSTDSSITEPLFRNLKNTKAVGDANKLIHDAVLNSFKQDSFPLTIGGDHSIAIGTISAVLENNPNTGIIWVDAHTDINTPSSTPSGNLHGCPVAILMGLDSEEYPESFQWVKPLLKPNKIVYIGLRDVDSGEKEILRKLNIKAFSMYHVDKYGINKVLELAIEHLGGSTTPIHLSYDVDAIDPQYVPATGTPVRGGLTLREGLFIGEFIAETKQLKSMDLVECNPDLGISDQHVVDTITAGLAITRCALGETLI